MHSDSCRHDTGHGTKCKESCCRCIERLVSPAAKAATSAVYTRLTNYMLVYTVITTASIQVGAWL